MQHRYTPLPAHHPKSNDLPHFQRCPLLLVLLSFLLTSFPCRFSPSVRKDIPPPLSAVPFSKRHLEDSQGNTDWPGQGHLLTPTPRIWQLQSNQRDWGPGGPNRRKGCWASENSSSQCLAEPRENFLAVSTLKAVTLSGKPLLSIFQPSDLCFPASWLWRQKSRCVCQTLCWGFQSLHFG